MAGQFSHRVADRKSTDCTANFCSSSLTSDVDDSSSQNVPTKDAKSLEFFYNLGIDYFRQCVQRPPPILQSEQPQCRPSHQGVTQPLLRHQAPSVSPLTSDKNSFRPPRPASCNSLPANGRSPENRSLETCRLGFDRPTKAGKGSPLTRSLSETADREKHPHNLAVQGASLANNGIAVGNKDKNASVDVVTSQSMEEPMSHDHESPVQFSQHTDLACSCTWMTTQDGSQDSGCMSDLSSAGGDSPSAATSPCMVTESTPHHKSDDDGTLTKNIHELEHDSKNLRHEMAHCNLQPILVTPVPPAIQARSVVTSPSRYSRPMRQIPVRFQRLLVAETERVAMLCERLSGCSLYSAATPDTALQSADENPTTSSFQLGSYDDKMHAEQPSYTPMIYAPAGQYNGLAVYPPPSRPGVGSNGCVDCNPVEPAQYVVPLDVGEQPQSCGSSASMSTEELPPSVLANPVYYYPCNPSLPHHTVGSTISYMIPTPGLSGCPSQWERGSDQTKRVQPRHVDATTGVFQPVSNDGYFYYSSPCCTEVNLPPGCSVQVL